MRAPRRVARGARSLGNAKRVYRRRIARPAGK